MSYVRIQQSADKMGLSDLSPQQQQECMFAIKLGIVNCSSIPQHPLCCLYDPNAELTPVERCTLGIRTGQVNCSITPKHICCVDIPDPALRNALSICITVMLAVVMIGMGCSVEIQKVITYLKRPIGPIVGLLCQYSKYAICF